MYLFPQRMKKFSGIIHIYAGAGAHAETQTHHFPLFLSHWFPKSLISISPEDSNGTGIQMEKISLLFFILLLQLAVLQKKTLHAYKAFK